MNEIKSFWMDDQGVLSINSEDFKIGDFYPLESIDFSLGKRIEEGKYSFLNKGHLNINKESFQNNILCYSPGLQNKFKIQKFCFEYFPTVTSEINEFSLSFNFIQDYPELWEEAKKSFHWIPNIKQNANHVAGQHVFRSPVVITTAGPFGAALIPDLKEITDKSDWHRYLDLDFCSFPRMEYGIKSIVPDGHVYYRPDGKGFNVNISGISLSFYILTFHECSSVEILNVITSFQWERFASVYEKKLLPQTVPFTKYAEYGNGMALQYLWQQGPNEKAGGIALTTFRREDGVIRGREYKDDIWFHSWFNNMRTAYELAEFGYRMNRATWIENSKQIANCLLSSPQKEGLFPTIYVPEDRLWIGSSKHGGGPEFYSLPDCAWSALWLRKFIKDQCKVEGAEVFLKNFRNFLCKHQDSSGGFPCWISKENLSVESRLNNSASGALCIWFLGEELLYDSVPGEEKSEVLKTIISGVEYIRTNILPQQKFEDFELYYSCSRKSLDFYDKITAMFGQNTLAIQWCAESFRAAYLLTKNEKYMESGLFCLHLLSLYQQIWNPPFINLYAFGGFGVMNTDGEWNDARQAQFAETFSNFYDITGDFEYIRRAIAAARASFALMVMEENRLICPENYKGTTANFEVHGGSAENYGHGGRNQRAYQSGFHWGTGSALVTAARMKRKYGDLLIDLKCKEAVGIDGIVVVESEFGEHHIKLKINTLESINLFQGKVLWGGKDLSYLHTSTNIDIIIDSFYITIGEQLGCFTAKRL